MKNSDKTSVELTNKIFVALDTNSLKDGQDLARKLNGKVGGLKIGKEFFTSHGPAGVRKIMDQGLPIFLDLKFHDIPNTVVGAVKASISLKPLIINVHAAGGKEMMSAAIEAAIEEAEILGIVRPLVLAVTVLTSLDIHDFPEIGLSGSPDDQVKRLAILAKDSGLDGVVCSAREIEVLREECGPQFKILTPGIRPKWANNSDQKRVDSPSEALAKGADYMVIGRPITESDDPVAAVKLIKDELKSVS